MTTIYFVRHCEPNFENHDDLTRELSEKGMADRTLVTAFLEDKSVDAVLSSPYKRSVDTVKDFADKHGLAITTIADFRERKISDGWIDNFAEHAQKQWADFDYKITGGESFNEVQKRNIRALNSTLNKYKDKTVAIASHGFALSCIINYYDKTYGYADFKRIKSIMPWIVKFVFDRQNCVSIEQINVLDREKLC